MGAGIVGWCSGNTPDFVWRARDRNLYLQFLTVLEKYLQTYIKKCIDLCFNYRDQIKHYVYLQHWESEMFEDCVIIYYCNL